MHLYLCGFQGCGKTFFGSRLALSVTAPFIDTDCNILTGTEFSSIRSMYQVIGKNAFREREQEAVLMASQQKSSVIALGGGAVESVATQSVIEETGVLVYLFVPKEHVLEGILRNEKPAYLSDISDYERFYDDRHAVFAACAKHVVPIKNCETSEVLEQLQKIWQVIVSGPCFA